MVDLFFACARGSARGKKGKEKKEKEKSEGEL